jgi:hypothetical protein
MLRESNRFVAAFPGACELTANKVRYVFATSLRRSSALEIMQDLQVGLRPSLVMGCV